MSESFDIIPSKYRSVGIYRKKFTKISYETFGELACSSGLWAAFRTFLRKMKNGIKGI